MPQKIISEFLKLEAAGGIILIFVTAATLIGAKEAEF